MRIVFAGTSAFAIPTLEALLNSQHKVVAVLTAPDKAAGRGLKLQFTPVKAWAVQHGLKLFQPADLNEPALLNAIKNLNPDVMIVVAFRKLPAALWQIPVFGTINLHASLLPQYRGAAPIHHAIMNGETETGLTTFFINDVIDTGHILLQEKILIGPQETAGELHDRMKYAGAHLVLKTLQGLESGQLCARPQDEWKTTEPLKTAPRLLRHHCRINWNRQAIVVYNHIRGLSPKPGAFTFLKSDGHPTYEIKIYRASILQQPQAYPGVIDTDGKTFLHIGCCDDWIAVHELQTAGKRRMSITDWLNGTDLKRHQWKAEIN
jgi:methionyl-tRNA formyltransferase